MTEPAERAWTLFRRFADAHSRHAELAEALGFGLGAGRGKVLFALRDGPMTFSEIAVAHGFDAPYATLIVDKLEAHGLVERRPHPGDRRRKLVALSGSGEEAIATADAILHRPPAALSALTTEELEQLATSMRRVLQADETMSPRSVANASQVAP